MTEYELTPEQNAELQASMAELARQLDRVDVSLQEASPHLREAAPRSERQISDREVALTLSVDVTGMLDALRALPKGAGTVAFVNAYNNRFEEP
jgi:hypothetical protein